MVENSGRVNAIFIFDLNRKPDLDHPSDKDLQLSKILYYHPEDRSTDDKLSHFGLIEGLIALSKYDLPHISRRNYTEDNLEFIRSKLYTTAVVPWFGSVYLAVVFVNNAGVVEEKDEFSYHWRNNMLRTILRNAIKIFEMFHGKLQNHLIRINNDEMTLERLQALLDSLLPTFMNNSTKSTLHLLKGMTFPSYFSDVEAFKKIHANMPLTLDVQMMVDDLLNEFEPVSKSMLIYNSQVLHSTIELEEMFLIYSYIVRYHGEVSADKSLTVKWSETNHLTIVDSAEDKLYSPQIYINDKLYTITILSTAKSILILLMETDDPLMVLNSIYEYMSKMQLNLTNLEEKLAKLPAFSNTKFFALNSLSKSINSAGFDTLTIEAMEELSIIYDLHDMVSNSREQIFNAHVKTKNRWVNTKFHNSREVYYVNNSNANKSSLSESKLHFEKFVNTYFNGIYFI